MLSRASTLPLTESLPHTLAARMDEKKTGGRFWVWMLVSIFIDMMRVVSPRYFHWPLLSLRNRFTDCPSGAFWPAVMGVKMMSPFLASQKLPRGGTALMFGVQPLPAGTQ